MTEVGCDRGGLFFLSRPPLDSAPKASSKDHGVQSARKGVAMSTQVLKTTFTLGALACALTIAAASSSSAQGRLCAKRDDVVKQLASVHGESRQSVGLQKNARVMETFANPETGTWTIIVSLPTGLSCLVAAGEAFQADLTVEGVAPTVDEDPA